MKPDISNREEENMTSKNGNEVLWRVIKVDLVVAYSCLNTVIKMLI